MVRLGAGCTGPGTLARWRSDGVLEFLGRSDAQVKLRGFRIEPGEIEAALLWRGGCCAGRGCGAGGPCGSVRVWWVTWWASAGFCAGRGVRFGRLSRRLPDYMVPSAVVVLDRLPLTPNGKLDRRALPAPDAVRVCGVGRGRRRRRSCARCLRRCWGSRRVGIDDNFFELGGDSIMSIQLVSRARRAGLRRHARAMCSSIRRWRRWRVLPGRRRGDGRAVHARRCDRRPAGDADHALAAAAGRADRALPSGGAAAGAGGPAGGASGCRVTGGARSSRCVAAAREVCAGCERRDASFEIAPAGPVDAAVVPAAHRRRAAWMRLRGAPAWRGGEQAAERLAPAAGAMLQAVWFDAGPAQAGRLLLTIHHLSVDGVSWRILVPDLAAAWHAIANGAGAGAAVARQFVPPFRAAACGARAASGRGGRACSSGRGLQSAPALSAGGGALDPRRDIAGTAGHVRLTLAGCARRRRC